VTETITPIEFSLAGIQTQRSKGRLLWVASQWKERDPMLDRLLEVGVDVSEVRGTVAALGLIADRGVDILWLDSLDGELTLDEILDALRIPRLINPLAVVLTPTLAAENPLVELGPSDEVLDSEECKENPGPLLQLLKVTHLERQIIQREHDILNSLPHALLIVDHNLMLWKVNTKVESLLEIHESDFQKRALGRHIRIAFAAALIDSEHEPFQHLVGALEKAVRDGRQRFRVKEMIGGSERLLSGEITRLVHSPNHFLVDLRDITADEQAVLVEARRERLATIGNLSVGVAHEIQNPNTFSRVNAANLKMMFDAVKTVMLQAASSNGGKIGNMSAEVFVKKAAEAISGIDMASRRIESVLATLKAFGRNDDGELLAVDVKLVVDEAVMLVKHEARGKCEIILDVPENLPAVIASPTGLSQVFVNLLQNALQALQEDKKQKRGQGQAEIAIRVETVNDEEVILSFTDNGPGIPEHIQEKIFRPYFTTKPQGQGTGLGLSISTEMMHRFGGDLTLRSKAGEGATFYIKLRRHEESPDHS
jgi:signal transduction histidine kinase